MYQVIVYDAVGTVIHVKPSVASVYAEVGRRFGSQRSMGDVRARFAEAFRRQEQLDRSTGWRTDEAREMRRWREIVADVLDDVRDPEACFEVLFQEFSKSEVWACDPEAAAVFAEFKRRGLTQALASNFDARLHGLVTALPPMRLLSPIVISSEVGWRKPAPQFFARLAAILGHSPREILYVGDDRTNDWEGARQAGMTARLLDPRRQHLDVPERIDRLSELLTL